MIAVGDDLAQAIRRVAIRVRGVANGDTEDVVQEAVARAIKSGVSLEAEQWLSTVAKRVAIDQHRRKRDIPCGAPVDLERWAANNEGDPEEAFIRSERAQAVREALDALPPRYRKVLIAYAEEDSPADVATRLGMSAAATWTLLSRARTRLRLQLESAGFVPALVTLSRNRWSRIVAAGAAAGVAATAAFAPVVPRPQPGPVKTQTGVVQAVATPSAAAAAKKKTEKTLALPIATDDVAEKVTDSVKQVQQQAASVKLNGCVGNLSKKLKLEIEYIEDSSQRDLLGELIKALPAPLRAVGQQTCAR